jgi:glutamate/tyrosine decarboxylase-like PLP-dependent enzyme
LYKNKTLRRPQFFSYTNWSGGIYASPTMAGTRPGGVIAAAWAILNHLGEDGYRAIAQTVMETVARLREGIAGIEGVHILGEPVMSILALGSDRLDVYQIGDELAVRGWHLDRQQSPPSLHLTVTHAHAQVVNEFLRDLADAVAQAKAFSWAKMSTSLQVGIVRAAARLLPEKWMSALTSRASSLAGFDGATVPQRSAAMYGMMASLPNRGDLDKVVLDILEELTQVEEATSG